jgi:hypothetical protein
LQKNGVALVAVFAYLIGRGFDTKKIAEITTLRPQAVSARVAYYRRRGYLPPISIGVQR